MNYLQNLGFTYFPNKNGWEYTDSKFMIKVREEGDKFLAHLSELMDGTSWGGNPEQSWYCSLGTYRLDTEQLKEAVTWASGGFPEDYELSDWGDEINIEPRLQ